MSDARLRRILGRLPGVDPDKSRVTPLSGGITNRNYRIQSNEASLVVRLGGKGARFLGIDRRREATASRAAASLGIGAEVVAFFPRERALVTRFITGRTLTAARARRPEALRSIGRRLRQIHRGPRFPGRFSPFDSARRYARLARRRGGPLPAEAARALQMIPALQRALGKPPAAAPCHNDLLAANFLEQGRSIRIIDWEYAAMGDPGFDLGNFCVNQGLDSAQRRRLLAAYGTDAPEALRRVELMMLASDLREGFWGLLQSRLSRLDFDFAAYSRKHLKRFLRGALRRGLRP